ncbi:uncharacterized protein LOC125265325 [Megalobrama amblycephala]|uniref:uncharacterized protein LOC125265325 n=1 Tax=Megalobrama amblycephala TaxID=75352 RepID=UPI0020141C17|nr:uncharacterized protein LOC125265325 [Megalobrama amblycephala]
MFIWLISMDCVFKPCVSFSSVFVTLGLVVLFVFIVPEFKEYVDWVLLRNGCPFTICEKEDDDSAPSTTTSPVTDQPEPTLKPEANVVPECEPEESSVEVCEPATTSVPKGILVEFEGMKWSPSPSTAAEEDSLIDWPFSSSCAASLAPPRTSRPETPPRPVKQSAPPWLHPGWSFLPRSSGSALVSHRSTCSMDLPGLQLLFVPPLLQLQRVPPSLQLCLGPQSLHLLSQFSGSTSVARDYQCKGLSVFFVGFH